MHIFLGSKMSVESKYHCLKSGNDSKPAFVRKGRSSVRNFRDEYGNDRARAHIRCNFKGVGSVTVFEAPHQPERLHNNDVAVLIKDWAEPNSLPLIQLTADAIPIKNSQYVDVIARNSSRLLRIAGVFDIEKPLRLSTVKIIRPKEKLLVSTDRERKASKELAGVFTIR